MPANAGRPSRGGANAFGPAWLHSAFGTATLTMRPLEIAKSGFRLLGGGGLILFGLFLADFTLEHLWKIYSPLYTKGYSFGIYLTYGGSRIWDPWSDLIIIICAALSISSGIFIIRRSKS